MANTDYKWYREGERFKPSLIRSIRAKHWLRKHKNWVNNRQKRKALNKYLGV